MRKHYLLFAALLSSQAFAQKLSEDEKSILVLQDQRSLGNGKLVAFLGHSNPKLRYRAVLACANIQDSTTLEPLIPLLKDQEKNVRAAAAFALGQIGLAKAQAPLQEMLTGEKDNIVLSRTLEALGRVGDRSSLDVVTGLVPKEDGSRADQAMAVARFALRNIKSESSAWLCFDLLQQKNQEVHWKALYALWRASPSGLIDVELSKRRDQLALLAGSTNSYVRAHLATLLGRSKSNDAIDLLKAIEKAEQKKNDWKVQVQLARAFAAFVPKDSELLGRLVRILDSPNPHVRIAALQALTSLTNESVQGAREEKRLGQRLTDISRSAFGENRSVQGEALVALGKHFPEALTNLSTLLVDKDTPPLVKSKFLEGLSFNPSSKNLDIFLERLIDESPRVSMAAWDFVKRLFSPSSSKVLQSQYAGWTEVEGTLHKRVNTSLSRRDMGISTLVANALSDSSFRSLFKNGDLRTDIVRSLMRAYEEFSSPNDVEAQQAILASFGSMKDTATIQILEKALKDRDKTVALEAAKALEKITGRGYSSRIPPSTVPDHVDYDWQLFESIPNNQKVLLNTSRGEVMLELRKEHAPFTVLSFSRLIKKGFFDGLNFHRVVPNFVVQGGDPRGDGWGGPGYSIRSEFSLIGYERGTVGVASAGKDTEGCQFFVTHSPQPHLDGRYTVFALVVQGMEVIDKIQVGDKILAVRFVD